MLLLDQFVWHPTLAHQISPPAGYLGRHPRIAKPESCKVFLASRRNSRWSFELHLLQTSQAPLWSPKQWFKTKHI